MDSMDSEVSYKLVDISWIYKRRKNVSHYCFIAYVC